MLCRLWGLLVNWWLGPEVETCQCAGGPRFPCSIGGEIGALVLLCGECGKEA